ncbi:hypothetical protein MBM_08560 [Drepanopeziza brunnea f. sp. 'multigermtubi' MB_m1]|uniref:Uncharacterized protein n=1 Tax=Marssonina brunnea f. sp. multigermtubi (strain MB_m1) TaxID=1072389 RepID=K1WLK8_MARBU|nr:uncharacterized protein MBM_08560 [Drepanopeziza brunnea f. sp. 'multigermtubi' MB_m1]EKD13117.1 hypothetical protein MBM_08560 [Drepanopeziza brunnea f. sp. 'multigermtubi' MB_m1]
MDNEVEIQTMYLIPDWGGMPQEQEEGMQRHWTASPPWSSPEERSYLARLGLVTAAERGKSTGDIRTPSSNALYLSANKGQLSPTALHSRNRLEVAEYSIIRPNEGLIRQSARDRLHSRRQDASVKTQLQHPHASQQRKETSSGEDQWCLSQRTSDP